MRTGGPLLGNSRYERSEKSIGFDGLLNFYAGRNEVCDLKFEQAFINYMGWEGNVCIAHPYVIDADRELIDRIAQNDMVRGITIAAGGFFGPQGRRSTFKTTLRADRMKTRLCLFP